MDCEAKFSTLPSSQQGVGIPPLIASELKEIKLAQSLQLQEIKSSLQSLERTVKVLSERSDKRLTDTDVIDVDSLLSSFSSSPPPSESSCTSALLTPAFGSPLFGSTSASSNFHPMIPSLTGKQMRARPALNVLEKLPIFLCCNSSKSYLFCLLAVPTLLINAHTLAQTKYKLPPRF